MLLQNHPAEVEPRVAEYINALERLIIAREGYAPVFTWVDIPLKRTDGQQYLTPVRLTSDGIPIGHGSDMAEHLTTTQAHGDATSAFWDMTEHLRGMIAREVLNAHHRVRAEISYTLGIYHHRWVDDEAIEQIVDEMSLSTTAVRIIERHTSEKPLGVNHYTDAVETIRRDANDAMARAIGDTPRRGYQIRKLARELSSTDVTVLHQHLTSQGIGIRMDTIERALNPVPTADAVTDPIEETNV